MGNSGQNLLRREDEKIHDEEVLKVVLNSHHGMNSLTALHVATMNNSLDAVTLLLEKGASIEATDSRGQTALHKASKRGYTDIVRVLLEYGGDPETKDMYGRTPVQLAQPNSETYGLLNTESLIVQLLPNSPPELVKKCKNELSKGILVLKESDNNFLKIRGDIGALLDVKAKVQKIIVEYFDAHDMALDQKIIGKVPEDWGVTRYDQTVQIVSLSKDSDEYTRVEEKFTKTWPRVEIVDIQRIQNRNLYMQYALKKHTMEVPNEEKLFHGTKGDATHQINAQGFNRSFAGQNAAAYGNGVYFAIKASYSANDVYSPPDTEGHKNIYLSLVLTGEYTAGKKGMKVPPPKDPAKPAELYDSVVDNMDDQHRNMFIVFHDCQAYPNYLIKFKNVLP